MSDRLPKSWDIPDLIRARLGDRPGKQRAMLAEGHLLLVLHALPKSDEAQRQAVFYWRSSEGQWKSTGGSHGAGSLKSHLESYQHFLDQLEARYDSAQVAADYFHILEGVSPVCRSARNLHAALQSAREQPSSG